MAIIGFDISNPTWDDFNAVIDSTNYKLKDAAAKHGWIYFDTKGCVDASDYGEAMHLNQSGHNKVAAALSGLL
jgi:hypothetical protein